MYLREEPAAYAYAGKAKCMMKSGDCVVKHGGTFTTGLGMVICYCEDHVRRKGVKYTKGQVIPCPKCNNDTSEVKELSMSTRRYDYGRQQIADDDDDDDYGGGFGAYGGFSFSGYGVSAGGNGSYADEESEEEDDDDDDEDEEEEDEQEGGATDDVSKDLKDVSLST
nr:hypothetical protein BaRGS_016871 [Batillaria attramentaria]